MLILFSSCGLNSHSSEKDEEQQQALSTRADTVSLDSLIVVGWRSKHDPLSPANYTVPLKLGMTFLVSLIALAVTAASAIDAVGVAQYSQEFGVSTVVGSLATGKTAPNNRNSLMR